MEVREAVAVETLAETLTPQIRVRMLHIRLQLCGFAGVEKLAPEMLMKRVSPPSTIKHTQMTCQDYEIANLPDGSARCLRCNKNYSDVQNARQHYRKFHGVDPPVRIQCTICGKCSHHPTQFRVHINRVHKIVGVKNIVGTYGIFVDPDRCLAHSNPPDSD